jgi:hypothetical protein
MDAPDSASVWAEIAPRLGVVERHLLRVGNLWSEETDEP